MSRGYLQDHTQGSAGSTISTTSGPVSFLITSDPEGILVHSLVQEGNINATNIPRYADLSDSNTI